MVFGLTVVLAGGESCVGESRVSASIQVFLEVLEVKREMQEAIPFWITDYFGFNKCLK